MNKIVFLSYAHQSHWQSCIHLSQELEHVYGLAFAERMIFLKIDAKDDEGYYRTIEEICALKPAVVVFADHRIENVPLWIKDIKHRLKAHQQIHWSIHAFGCFIGRIREWIRLKEVASEDSVSIIAASKAQQQAINTFFVDQRCVETFHIPFNEKNSGFEHGTRQAVREKLGLKEDEFALVYAGRISYQKNVHHLVGLVTEYGLSTHKKVKLFICGSPDDINPRQFPHAYHRNYAVELFSEALAKSQMTTFLGQLTFHQLLELYQGMDLAISLSTFDGEDYGRSLVEALATGLPVIATGWGGYRDLTTLPQVKLLKVSYQKASLQIDQELLFNFLDEANPSLRTENIEHFQKVFAPRASIKHLQKIYQSPQSLPEFNKMPFLYIMKSETKWNTKEFFETHEQTLYPYWA